MRALAVLGAVAALLAAYLLFFEHDPRSAGPAGEAVRLLPAFDRAALTRVTVARAGEPPFALVRGAGGGWRLQPGDQPANQGAVEDLLGALEQAESARGADVSPAAAGLSPARVTLSLDDGGRSAELRLGRTDASGRGVFVQVGAAGPIRVGPQRLLQLADRPADALRDRRLVPFAPDQVAGVSWRAGPDDREHRLDRQGPGWRNAAGERVAAERVATVLRALADLKGDRDAGPAPDQAGWIEVRDGSGATARIAAGSVPRDAWDQTWRLLAAAEAADRRLLSTPPERVRRIELDDGARRLVLVRDGAWTMEAPSAGTQVEQSIVNDWLAKLAHTEATSPAAHGRRLVVDGATADAVTVGPRDPAYELLDPDPLRFRSREVLDFAHFDVRELRRISAAGTFDVTTRDGETWASVPAGGAVDQAAVGRLAGALGNLRAESFLSHPPPGRPDLVLEVQVQPPGAPTPARHTLQLWPACVAQADGAGAFRIARAACDELRRDPAAR